MDTYMRHQGDGPEPKRDTELPPLGFADRIELYKLRAEQSNLSQAGPSPDRSRTQGEPVARLAGSPPPSPGVGIHVPPATRESLPSFTEPPKEPVTIHEQPLATSSPPVTQMNVEVPGAVARSPEPTLPPKPTFFASKEAIPAEGPTPEHLKFDNIQGFYSDPKVRKRVRTEARENFIKAEEAGSPEEAKMWWERHRQVGREADRVNRQREFEEQESRKALGGDSPLLNTMMNTQVGAMKAAWREFVPFDLGDLRIENEDSTIAEEVGDTIGAIGGTVASYVTLGAAMKAIGKALNLPSYAKWVKGIAESNKLGKAAKPLAALAEGGIRNTVLFNVHHQLHVPPSTQVVDRLKSVPGETATGWAFTGAAQIGAIPGAGKVLGPLALFGIGAAGPNMSIEDRLIGGTTLVVLSAVMKGLEGKEKKISKIKTAKTYKEARKIARDTLMQVAGYSKADAQAFVDDLAKGLSIEDIITVSRSAAAERIKLERARKRKFERQKELKVKRQKDPEYREFLKLRQRARFLNAGERNRYLELQQKYNPGGTVPEPSTPGEPSPLLSSQAGEGGIQVRRHVSTPKKPELVLPADKGPSGAVETTEPPTGVIARPEPGSQETKPVTGQELTETQPKASELEEAGAQTEIEPTEGQKEAGNYKKGHINLSGLDISIENPKGSVRSGTNKSGKQWEQELANTYGYIKRTKGADGDQVDVFINDERPEGPNAHIIYQNDPETGEFDEHKVMLGFESESDATMAYLDNYEEGWVNTKAFGGVEEMNMEDFKEWLDSNEPVKSKTPSVEEKPKKTEGVVSSLKSPELEYADEYRDWLLGIRETRPDVPAHFIGGQAYQLRNLQQQVEKEVGRTKPLTRDEFIRRLANGEKVQVGDATYGIKSTDYGNIYTVTTRGNTVTRGMPMEHWSKEYAAEEAANKAFPTTRVEKPTTKVGNIELLTADQRENAVPFDEAGWSDFYARDNAIASYLTKKTGREVLISAGDGSFTFKDNGEAVPNNLVREAFYAVKPSPQDIESELAEMSMVEPRVDKELSEPEEESLTKKAKSDKLNTDDKEAPDDTRKGMEKEDQATLEKTQAEDVRRLEEIRSPGRSSGRDSESGRLPVDTTGVSRAGRRAGMGDSKRNALPSDRRGRTEPGRTRKRASTDRGRNFRITADTKLGEGTPDAKYKKNLGAIQIIRQLEAEDRPATPEEQEAIAQYAGWGAVPQVFDRSFDYAYELLQQEEAGETLESWNQRNLRDAKKHSWWDRHVELRRLLSDDEYEAARSSTVNAHFTAPDVIRGMYSILEHIGFKGGRMLETSAGTGHMIGMQPDLENGASWTAVELDPLTSKMLSALYPEANVRHGGYENTRLPNNFYDIAMSNVPFGDYRLHDPKFNKYKFPIHDYFFAKTLDKIRPGGVMAFVTSRYTLDKKDKKLIRYLSEHGGEIIGAVRLPRTAFKAFAGTDVVTDIIFIRKTADGKEADNSHFMKTVEHQIGEATVTLNEYFVKNPKMIAGTLDTKGSMYRSDELSVAPAETNKSLFEQIATVARAFPEDAYLEPIEEETADGAVEVEPMPAPEDLKDGNLTIGKDGRVYVVQDGMMVPEDVKGGQAGKARIRGMLDIRTAVRGVLKSQVDNQDDDVLAKQQKKLSKAYDSFVKQFGPLHHRANVSALRQDVDAPLILALEQWDDDKKEATKSDIFTKRVIVPPQIPSSAETAQDALTIAVNETGRLDWDRMANLTGKTPKQLQDELLENGDVFINPETDQYEIRGEYLSGYVKDKLQAAKAAAQHDPAFSKNVVELEKVQPEPIPMQHIAPHLGSPWIPNTVYNDFMEHLTHNSGWELIHNNITGTWGIAHQKGGVEWKRIQQFRRNSVDWGTPRFYGHQLVEKAMNGKVPRVWDTVGNSRTLNKKETNLAQQKVSAIKDEFGKWIYAEETRAKMLVDVYNDTFNNSVPRQWDGSQITLPGLSPLWQTYLSNPKRLYQKAVILRGIQGGNLLLNHVVGAGKTIEMIGIGMEIKRLGLAKKPMYVVPNHKVGDWAEDFRAAYPAANILIGYKELMAGNKRKEFLSRIATGNWDGVIVAHSTYERIGMSPAAQAEYIRKEIKEIEDAILSAREQEGEQERPRWGRAAKKKGSKIVKQLEKTKDRLSAKMQKLAAREKKDTMLSFEELGVDYLFVDEAHNFKGLPIYTSRERVAGLQQSSSQRAVDMEMKCNYINNLHGGKRGVVFATGTPVSNSISEVYVLLRFLAPDILRRHGIKAFDDWGNTFGEVINAVEVTPTGDGYRVHPRFAKFQNVGELMRMMLSFTDVKLRRHLDIRTPPIIGGKPTIHAADATPTLKNYIQSLVERADAVKTGLVDSHIDNMLKITNDGRKVALDERMIDPTQPDNPKSKVNQAVESIHDIWKRTKKDKATQLVFCDLGVPKGKSSALDMREAGAISSQPFDVYTDIKRKLMKKGVPTKQIAFIHDAKTDAKKEALFSKVRLGKVRILIGNTPRMGEGTNVQDRLYAVHHLDAPWKPAHLEQRNGRILRPGNMFTDSGVEIHNYVTKESFDAYMWQTVERKALFIEDLWTADIHTREIEDIDSTALTASEMKAIASGNPLVAEKIGVEKDIEKLQMKKDAAEAEIQNRKWAEKQRVAEIRRLEQKIEGLKTDIPKYENEKPEKFEIKTAPGKIISEPKDVEAETIDSFHSAQLSGTKKSSIGSYAGFDVGAEVHWMSDGLGFITVKHEGWTWRGREIHLGTLTYSDGSKEKVNVRKAIVGHLGQLPKVLASAEAELARAKKEMEAIAATGVTFDQQDKLDKLLARLGEINHQLGIGTSDTSADTMTDTDEDIDEPPDARGPSGTSGSGTVGFPSDLPISTQPDTPPDPILDVEATPLGVIRFPLDKDPVIKVRGKPVNASEIMDALEGVVRAAGSVVPIRVGHFKHKAQGVFKIEPEVIRLREANNIPTAAHETAHALEKAVYGWVKGSPFKTRPRVVQDELMMLGRRLYGNTKPSGGYKREGFAEFIRILLTADNAKQVAPHTFRWFEKRFLTDNPEVAKTIVAAKEKITTFRKMGSEKRVEAAIGKTPKPGIWGRVKSALSKKNWVEEGVALERLVKAAETLGERELPIVENPYLTYSALRHTHTAKTRYMIEKGMIDLASNVVGPPLAEIAAIVRKQGKDRFTLYLYARRAKERWAKGKNPGISLEDAEYIIEKYETPKFELAAQKVYDWNRGVLNYALQGGLINSEAYNKIVKESEDYVPLTRVFDESDTKAMARIRKAGGNPLKIMKGSGRRVKNIFQAMIENAEKIVRKTHERFILNQILRLRHIEGMGHMIEEIPKDKVPVELTLERIKKDLESAGVDLGEAELDAVITMFVPAQRPAQKSFIVPMMEDGKLKWFEVDPELYDDLQGLDIYRLPKVLDLFLGMPARTFRMGTTGLRAAFSLFTNPLRDVQAFMIQTHSNKNPAALFTAWLGTFGKILVPGVKTKELDLFRRVGGEMAMPLGIDTKQTERAARNLFMNRYLRVVTTPVEILRDVLQIPEMATRSTEAKAMTKEIRWDGKSPLSMSQSLEMGLATKRVTVDFSASGKLGKIINQCIPFFNPAIQGVRTFARTLKKHPRRSILRALLLITLPTLYLWWKNKDKRFYRDMPYWERYTYYNVDDGENVWRIPKAFEWGNYFSVLPEAILDAWYEQEPEAVTEAFGHIFQNTNPLDYPVLLKIAKEQWENKIAFTDRPIVPQGELLANLPPGEQRGPYTSELAKTIGNIFPNHASPRRIDHAIRGYFGGLGPDILDTLGLGRPKDKDGKSFADLPVVGRAARRGGKGAPQSLLVDKFFDELKNVRGQRSVAKRHGEKESTTHRQYRLIMEDAYSAILLLRELQYASQSTRKKEKLQERIRGIVADAMEAKNDANAEARAKLRKNISDSVKQH